MQHQVAGGNNDRLPRQAVAAKLDSVEMALEFFGDRPIH
jgi:hypothetical protein